MSEHATKLTPQQVAAFRLTRHHLNGRGSTDLPALCRDCAGMQAQVLSASYLALWARNHRLTRDAIDAALHKHRTVVKTSAMRNTLHLLAADDYPLYIRALCASRLRHMRQVMARYGSISAAEANAIRDAAVAVLGEGPLLKREVQQRVLAGKRLSSASKKFFQLGWWGVVRQAIVEGLLCYGPERGAQTALICTEQWLGRLKEWDERAAQQEFLRRYLRAYGPATLRDFAYWSGFSIGEARPIWESLRGEMIEVGIGAMSATMLASDAKAMQSCRLAKPSVRLLPNFDVYLLGHADKSHLLDPRHYKRVFRSAGWISPVVLVDGRVAGIWSHVIRAKQFMLTVEPLSKPAKPVRTMIETEAEQLAAFLGLQAGVRFAR